MSIRIASFNIKDFGRVNSSESAENDTKKDLNKIADIIKNNKIDIIAIQEITDKEALKELLRAIAQQYTEEERLKRGNINYNNLYRHALTNDCYGFRTKNWEGRWAAPISKHGGIAAEGYAFIWNRDKIKLVTNYEGKVFEPRITPYGKKNTWVRPPFIGRFMPIKSRYEFRLINTHIAWGVTSKMKQEDSDVYDTSVTDIELRRKELKALIEDVYINLAQKRYDVNHIDRNPRYLDAYTFILGDYNMNLRSSVATGNIIPDELADHVYKNMRIVTVNNKLSTLKSESGIPDGLPPDTYLANNYDHFSYDANKIVNAEADVIYAFDIYDEKEDEVEDMSKYEIYRKKISDHIPVYMDIDRRNMK